MTDRELLVLAAKAVGIDVDADGRFAYPNGLWNPLTDDGDALRLVVTLGIHITNSQSDAWATTHAVTAIEPLTNNPYAATRRAIVRAAAEISRLTKE